MLIPGVVVIVSMGGSGKTAEYLLYGARGWGSAIAESMLSAASMPYRFEDVAGFDHPGPSRDRLVKVNSLAQIPVLILPDGRTLTETAAMALILDEAAPDAGLAPPPGSDPRYLYLHLLVWLVTNVYPTFTYGDYCDRWTSSGTDELRQSTNLYRQGLWTAFESMAPNEPWVLGRRFSVLDMYIAVMTHWRPRKMWFEEHCPKLARIADAAAARPDLAGVLALNFRDSANA